jgi:exopolysaccharide production protein ExoQ
MSKTSTHPLKLRRAGSSTPVIDVCAIVPILAVVYVIIVSPLLAVVIPNPVDGPQVISKLQSLMTPRLENKIFWPALVAISVVLAARNHSRLVRLTWPPHIICLLALLAFCGASVLWAFSPEVSFTRFMIQVMIITSTVLPIMLADRTADVMRGVFLCFALASTVNVFFVLNQPPMLYQDGSMLGYPGYFSFKGILGECAAITFLLSLHEIFYPGLRRAVGIIVAAIAISLIIPSYSKGSLAIAIIAPSLAALTLIIGKKMRISPAIVLLPIPLCFEVLSAIPGADVVNRISWHIYSNYTLSGRTVIWDFVRDALGRKPLLGWGFGSFWQVGLDGPSIVGGGQWWVAAMPSGHNGYLDMMLEIGYVGYPFLIIFIVATVHALGRVAERDPTRAWLLLSLALFIIITNTLESIWMRGGDMQWLVFLILVAEICRYWGPFPPDGRSQHRRVLRGPVIPRWRSGVALGHLMKMSNR